MMYFNVLLLATVFVLDFSVNRQLIVLPAAADI